MNPITGKDGVERHVDPRRRRSRRTRSSSGTSRTTSNRNSRGVSVVYDYKFDGSGRDYLIRNSEMLTEGETGKDLKYQIFDITIARTDPSKISLVSEITGTPPNSCGPGCGGPFILRAHKGWWSQETGYFYAASGEPGFRNVVIQIFDLKNPKAPKFVGRAWLPGLRRTASRATRASTRTTRSWTKLNKRLYVGYRNSGWRRRRSTSPIPRSRAGLVDRHEAAAPRSAYRVADRLRQGAELRRVCVAAHVCVRRGRSRGAADMAPCPDGVRAGSYMLDITNETKPFPVSVWQVPVGDFCTKGGPIRPASVGGNRQRPDQPVREQDRVARLLQRRHASGGSGGSVSPAGGGLLHAEDERALTPDGEGPAGRSCRSTTWTSTIAAWPTRPIARHRVVHPGIHTPHAVARGVARASLRRSIPTLAVCPAVTVTDGRRSPSCGWRNVISCWPMGTWMLAMGVSPTGDSSTNACAQGTALIESPPVGHFTCDRRHLSGRDLNGPPLLDSRATR